MDLNALRDEIQSGPLAADLAPHVASGDDAAITAALNAPRYAVLGGVERAQFAVWCGSSGLRAAIDWAHTTLAGSTFDYCRINADRTVTAVLDGVTITV